MKLSITTTAVFALALLESARAQERPLLQEIAPEFMKPGEQRKFAIEYVGRVSEIPAGTKKLRIWIPVPQNSTAQTISDLSFAPNSPSFHTEGKYGNLIAYWEVNAPKTNHQVTMRFVCERKEILTDMSKVGVDGEGTPPKYKPFLQPDRLVLIDDEIRKIAAEIAKGKSTTLEKGRAIYDYVLAQMTYDKDHPGWGLGSTRHACEVGKGNCTDFHALFNSLCRALGIASGFEIGLYLPYEKGKEETLGGYHCWAFFFVPGKTWVPVDCSEADRFAERREYFFGNHTANRVALSTGRDIPLLPAPAGEPLNYFLNPYVEADGKPIKAEKSWSFRDL